MQIGCVDVHDSEKQQGDHMHLVLLQSSTEGLVAVRLCHKLQCCASPRKAGAIVHIDLRVVAARAAGNSNQCGTMRPSTAVLAISNVSGTAQNLLQALHTLASRRLAVSLWHSATTAQTNSSTTNVGCQSRLGWLMVSRR